MQRRIHPIIHAGIVLSILSFAVVAYAATAICPIDGSDAHLTGNTSTDSEKGWVLYEFECEKGHKIWSKSSTSL